MGRSVTHIGYWWKSKTNGTNRKTRRRWVDNIKMDLRVIGWVGMNWIDLAEERTSGWLL
jgi:hypothetical protein